MFLQKSTWVRLRRKSLVTDPKNTGEECTFAITNRQLPLPLPPVGCIAMNARNQLLAMGTELLRDPVSFVRSRRDQVKVFSLPEGAWTCLLRDSPSDASWYFRPLGSQGLVAEPARSESNFPMESLSQDSELTGKLWDSLCSAAKPSLLTELETVCFVASHKILGAVLVVRCEELQLVADALHVWGEPSETVAKDWKNQRIGLSNRLPDVGPLHTAETFVSNDGILIPILFAGSIASKLIGCGGRLNELAELEASVIQSPDWPEPVGASLQSDAVWPPSALHADYTSSKIHLSGQTNRLRRSRTLIIAVAAVATMLLLSFSIFMREVAPIAEKDREFIAHSSEGITRSAIDVEIPDTDNGDLLLNETQSESETRTVSGEMTIATLESQMNPNLGELAFELSTNASSIVQDSLRKNGDSQSSSWPEWTDQTSTQGSEGSETDDVKRPGELEVLSTENGVVSLKKPIAFTSAWIRESILVGKPVIAKECRCVVELKAPKSATVEPSSAISIVGNGKQSWRFAIEDEDPELIVELTSKPGFRWQIMLAVGVRESPNASPMLLQPRDAQNVCNQLLLHSQWLDQRFELLQKSKTNKRDQSNRNLAAELKRTTAEQKDTAKAIERWRFIANLSHQFYDQAEIKMDFFPSEKK